MRLLPSLVQTPLFCNSKRFLGLFGGLCAFIASLAVLSNDFSYLLQYGLTLSTTLFLVAFTLAFLPSTWGLALVLTLLPLTAGLPSLIAALFSIPTLVALPNPGLDLVAGLFLGYSIRFVWRGMRGYRNQLTICVRLSELFPWPVALVLLVITASVVLGIIRNLYLSATSTSIKGLLFNLIHFRPVDWQADYLPLSNWVAYAIAVSLIAIVIGLLKKTTPEKRNALIFRSLMVGLVISAIIGLIQATTGLGLSATQLGFRKDTFGYAAIGMQPDLHAYASHMLLGVVGLWGYFLVCKSRAEKYLIILVILLCSAGLVLSKSRASLMIALLALLIFWTIYFFRYTRKYFFISFALILITIVLVGLGVKTGQEFAIPGLGWVSELLSQMQSRRLDNLSDLGGMMGSRFEIWSAAMNMFFAYPLMGVGEGEFYHLSSNISFARSEFLQLNHGENAHNYFLQVLAENGLLGMVVFTIAFIAPFMACKNKSLLVPSLIGLVSLFLGNIFAHSFLVRENLLLAAGLLGLLYVFAGDGLRKQNWGKNVTNESPSFAKRTHYLIGFASVILIAGMISEAYFSFGRLPFKAGDDCFVKALPLSADGWTSGAWEERLPKGARAIELTLIPNRPHLDKQPLNGRLEILSWEAGRGNVPINTATYRWSTNEVASLKLDLPPQYYQSTNLITTRLQLSSCFTPRDLGLNTDSRRLGVHVESLRYQ